MPHDNRPFGQSICDDPAVTELKSRLRLRDRQCEVLEGMTQEYRAEVTRLTKLAAAGAVLAGQVRDARDHGGLRPDRLYGALQAYDDYTASIALDPEAAALNAERRGEAAASAPKHPPPDKAAP